MIHSFPVKWTMQDCSDMVSNLSSRYDICIPSYTNWDKETEAAKVKFNTLMTLRLFRFILV